MCRKKVRTPDLPINEYNRLDNMTTVLLENGADWAIKDFMKRTPVDIAGVTPAYQGELKSKTSQIVALNNV